MRSTHDNIDIWLPDAKRTASAGASLAKTLYGNTTVFLRGELGAGKTTFLQGFGLGLGLGEFVKSPTYALEQRYGPEGNTLMHVDLYRLSPAEAAALVASSRDFPGIRCIEWSDRLSVLPEDPAIDIVLREEGLGRRLFVTFRDADIPSDSTIEAWRTEVHLPPHISAHCDVVSAFAAKLADILLARCTLVRRSLLRAAGRVHDLFRFVDFRSGADPPESQITESDRAIYAAWKNRFPGLRHEALCKVFLREQGFEALADIVAVHGLHLPSPARATIEQQLLFYADKRVREDQVVTLRERFDDFQRRYAGGKESKQSNIWYAEAQAIETSLFPEGPPR